MLKEDIKIITNIPEKKIIFGKEEKERYVKKNSMMIRMLRLKTIAILLIGIEEPPTTNVILTIENLIVRLILSNLFIKNLGFSQGNIDCIPNNEERYISFTKRIQVGSYTTKEGETKPLHHEIRFIDSFKFMAASLDSLVNNLPKDDFNNLKRYYIGDKLSLLTRKGVYPYEYMDSLERLKETKLPPKEAFIPGLMTKVSVMKITYMRKTSGKRLK